MPKVLLDSTAYMDLEKAPKHRRYTWAINSVRHTVQYRRAEGNPFLSIVTVLEILRGLYKDVSNQGKVQQFKQSAPAEFEFLDVTTDIGYLAGEIIAKLEGGRQTIGFPDSQIAATAIHQGLTLVTANTGHFQRVIDLGFPLTRENWRNA